MRVCGRGYAGRIWGKTGGGGQGTNGRGRLPTVRNDGDGREEKNRQAGRQAGRQASRQEGAALGNEKHRRRREWAEGEEGRGKESSGEERRRVRVKVAKAVGG